jgi:malate synthase
VRDLAPKNAALLAERDRLQSELDAGTRPTPARSATWPATAPSSSRSATWRRIPRARRPPPTNVDAELALQAGPQLVVPILNARYALNAANARWGSLYDALYGTDAIPETGGADKGPGYNEVRGAKVIAYRAPVLDQAAPLASGSHKSTPPATRSKAASWWWRSRAAPVSGLKDPAQFVGYQGDAGRPRRCC